MTIYGLWLQDVAYPARQDRIFADSIWTEGVLPPAATSLQVTQSSPNAMTVDVAVGSCVVTGDDQANQGKYLVKSEAIETVNIGAAPGSGSRHDLVVVQVRDPNATGPAGDDVIIDVIAGTPSGSPVDPSLPDSALPLARVRVPSGTGSITNALIDDLRDNSKLVAIQNIQDLDNVSISGLANGNLLRYNSGTTTWEPAAPNTLGLAPATILVDTKTASYTLVASDQNKLIIMNSGSATTVTIPTDSVTFPIGAKVDVWRQGSGTVTVSPAGGVTLNSRAGQTQLNAQYSGATLIKRANNTWLMVGDLL